MFKHTQHHIYFIKMGNLYHWVELFKRQFWAFESPRLDLRFAKYSRSKFTKLLEQFLKKKGKSGRGSLGWAGCVLCRSMLPRGGDGFRWRRLHLTDRWAGAWSGSASWPSGGCRVAAWVNASVRPGSPSSSRREQSHGEARTGRRRRRRWGACRSDARTRTGPSLCAASVGLGLRRSRSRGRAP